MRKVLTVIGLIIVFFVIYFLQVNTFTTFTCPDGKSLK